MVRRVLSLFALATILAAAPQTSRAQAAAAEKPAGPTFTPYGFVLLNAYFNSRPFNSVDYPDYAVPRLSGTTLADTAFLMEARAARLGVRIGLGEAVGAQLGAVIEGDFLAAFGTPNAGTGSTKIDFYRPEARMRLAFGTATWKSGDTSFRLLMGQDYGLVTPLFANTLAWITTPLFQNAGNPYIRAPQIQGKLDLGKDNGLTISAAVLDPQNQNPVGNTAAEESALLGPGNRSRIPEFDGRIAGRYKSGDIAGEVGVGGTYHKERYVTAAGQNIDLDTTMAGADWVLKFPFVELRGEAWLATNQDTYFVHLGQGGINAAGPTGTAFVTSVSNKRSKGGWLQATITPVPYFQLAAGYGVELPNPKDIRTSTNGARLRNSQAELEAIFILSKNWKASIAWDNTVTTTARATGTNITGINKLDGYQTVLSTQYTF